MTTAPLAWASGGPRVLLTDCWLQNAGDAAIAVAMQRIIRRAVPDAVIVHAAYGADAVAGRYDELEIVPPIDQLVGTRWAEGTAEGTEFVAAADVVVSQGGGFLRAGYRPWARIDALERVAALGPRTGLLGQTLGVFDEAFARRSLRAVLTAAETVVVRDSPSRASAIELGADADGVLLGTDFALSLALDPATPADLAARDVPVARAVPTDDPVGLVLSDHVVPGEVPNRGGVATTLLDAVLAATDRDVVVWSSSQGIPGDSDDDVVARHAVAGLPRSMRSRVRVVEGHLDAYDLLRWSTAFSSLVSMRFHPALLAAAAGIPSVLVMADGKTSFFDGSAMAHRIARRQDPRTLADVVALAVPGPERSTGTALLGPVLDRVAVIEDALTRLVSPRD